MRKEARKIINWTRIIGRLLLTIGSFGRVVIQLFNRLDWKLLRSLSFKQAVKLSQGGDEVIELAHKFIDDAPDVIHFMADNPSWRPNAILALGQMVIEGQTNAKAKELALKVMQYPDIPGMENWLIVASRQLEIPSQLLDLENSLDDAIKLWANDSATQMEVYYYQGIKVTYQQVQKLRSQATFDPKRLKNIDVETSHERREWKRVNRGVTNRRSLMSQINDARLKFRDAQLPRGSGGKENVAIVDFGPNLWPPYDDISRVEFLILRAFQNDQIAKTYLDKLIIQTNSVDLEIIVPLP